MRILVWHMTAALALAVVATAPARAQETGDLVVKTKPPFAEVTIDGEAMGKAPVTKSGLGTSVRHQVDVAWPDGSKKSARVKVKAGKPTTVRLEPPNLAAVDAPGQGAQAVPPSGAPSTAPAPSTGPTLAPAPPTMPLAMEPGPVPPPMQPSDSAMMPMSPTPSTSSVPPAAPTVSMVAGPILSARHPQQRGVRGWNAGAGVFCPNYGTPSVGFGGWCTPRARLGHDFLFGDVHVGILAGYALSIGGQLGFEVGSPYFRLGKRGRAALAIRTSADALISAVRVDTPGRADDGVFAFVNTYGPNLSVAIPRGAAFELRPAVGWSVAGFFDKRGFDSPVYALVVDLWIGVRFVP